MRSIIFVILIAAIGYGAYAYFSSSPNVNISVSDDDDSLVTMSNANVKGEFTEIGPFEIELRVFGVNSKLPKSGPFALMTDMLMVTPREKANSIFKKFLCEKNAVGQASMIQLIVNNPQSRKQLDKLTDLEGTRRCAYLSGTSYHMDHFFMDGKEMKGMKFTSSVKSDPYKYIKVDELKVIPCE